MHAPILEDDLTPEHEAEVVRAFLGVLDAVIALAETKEGVKAFPLLVALSDAWNVVARLLVTQGLAKGTADTDFAHSKAVLLDIVGRMQRGVDVVTAETFRALTLDAIVAAHEDVEQSARQQQLLSSLSDATATRH